MHNIRYLYNPVKSWLNDRMVFIGGPRQVGKTFFSQKFIKDKNAYINWDDLRDQQKIKKGIFPIDQKLIVLDEIHKFSKWRNLLKGIYDKNKENISFLVTGSARLDFFRKGGDSLFGRYHYFRMHPFTLPEAIDHGLKNPLDALLNFGGFPEPLIKQDRKFLKIWQRERKAKVILQDLRDLTMLKDYTDLDLLADCLPERVGSLLSLTSLAEDLEKSPHTISRWIEILESVYYCYTILPFGAHKIKAVKKSRNLYLWDWSEITDLGSRFENLVASHLLKLCHYIEDTEGDRMELRFLRDHNGKEIDFIVLKNKIPQFAVECKLKPSRDTSSLRLIGKKIFVKKLYQVHLEQDAWQEGSLQVLPFEKFCQLERLI